MTRTIAGWKYSPGCLLLFVGDGSSGDPLVRSPFRDYTYETQEHPRRRRLALRQRIATSRPSGGRLSAGRCVCPLSPLAGEQCFDGVGLRCPRNAHHGACRPGRCGAAGDRRQVPRRVRPTVGCTRVRLGPVHHDRNAQSSRGHPGRISASLRPRVHRQARF